MEWQATSECIVCAQRESPSSCGLLGHLGRHCYPPGVKTEGATESQSCQRFCLTLPQVICSGDWTTLWTVSSWHTHTRIQKKRMGNKQQSHGTSTESQRQHRSGEAAKPKMADNDEQLLLWLFSFLFLLFVLLLLLLGCYCCIFELNPFFRSIHFRCVYKNWRQENWNDIKWKFQYVRTIYEGPVYIHWGIHLRSVSPHTHTHTHMWLHVCV